MKAKVWPNGLGIDVRCGRGELSVCENGGTRHFEDADDRAGTHFTLIPRGPLMDMARAALDSWKSNRAAWTPIE